MTFWLNLVKDKRSLKPLILKLGVALAISFAGFLYSHLRTRRIGASPSSGDKKIIPDNTATMSPTSREGGLISLENMKQTPRQKVGVPASPIGLASITTDSGDEDGFLLPEFSELVLEEFEVRSNSTSTSSKKDVDTAVSKTALEKETEKDIQNLKNMVRILQEREGKLENQLLEFYGLKEQETAVMELQNRLKISSVEAKLFSLKIESLQAENKRLQAQLAEHSQVVSELESARAKIKLLKRKIRLDEEHTKEQLSDIRHKVEAMRSEEQVFWNDEDNKKRLQRLQDMERESTELKLANTRLQYENAELNRRLSSAQILAPEVEALQEANLQLRKANDDLTKEIEHLQANRCSDVEELVYIRWVNACLRYELRNCKSPPGKTGARDLSKTLSPKSEEKAKQLILEYANSEGGDKSILDFDSEYWSSSQGSSLTDSNDLDDSPLHVSSATKTSSSSRSSLFKKLRKLLQAKNSTRHNHSSADRSSTSYAGSGIRKTTSTSSFEDMRTLSDSTVSSLQSTTDEQTNKTTSRSPSFSRPSLDFHSQRTLSLDRVKEVDGMRRNSDVGYPYFYKRAALRESGVVSGLGKDRMDEQGRESEKLELIRFAEALKDSNSPQRSPYS